MRTLMLGSRTKQLTFWLMFWTWAFSTSSGRSRSKNYPLSGEDVDDDFSERLTVDADVLDRGWGRS